MDRLGQVIEGQQNPQMKKDFESIKVIQKLSFLINKQNFQFFFLELKYQVEKDKQSVLKTCM